MTETRAQEVRRIVTEGFAVSEITQVKLDEMLAGLEGVTRGPWENIVGTGIIRSDGHDGRHDVARSDLMWGLNRSGANAAHIARCDPDTMRQIITLAQQALASPPIPTGGEKE